MNVNYPIKYAVLELRDENNATFGFIASKSYVIEDSIRYLPDGSNIEYHYVVFPYSNVVDYIKKIAENKINNLKIEGNTQENKNFSFINPLIYEKQHHDNRDINKKNLKEHISDKINFKYIEPNYMSFYPILSNNIIFHNELKWILPGLKHNFIWENNCFDKIRYLINQILDNGAITTDEKNYVISSIKKKPNIINNINLTPKRMMELIEKDESLSFELLLIVCKTSLNE